MTLLPQARGSSDADILPAVSTIPALPTHHPNDNSNPQQGTGMLPETSPVASLGPSVSSASTRSYSTKIPPTHKDSRKLFVGGLPADVTEQEFREFFEQFGAVMDSVVMFDRDTHRSRGFGFVTFEDPAVCLHLLEMNESGEGIGRLVMRGKTCEVKAAQPKESSMRGMARYGRHSNMGSRPRGNVGVSQLKPFVPPHQQPTTFQPPSDPNLTTQMHASGSVPYMPDPNMHASMMYTSGHYGHYNSGGLYYPSSVPNYMAPMYYHNPSVGTVATYDPSSYLSGGHQYHHEAMDNVHSSPRGHSHLTSSVPLPHSVAQQPPYAYVPYNVPAPFVGYPSSVMQPLAPGLPLRPDESMTSAEAMHEVGQQNRE